MNIVWFKRDLRIEDNAAFTEASKLGPILPLYILEPELWRQPDMSYRHYAFLQECIAELDQSLRILGQKLIIKVAERLMFWVIFKNDKIFRLYGHVRKLGMAGPMSVTSLLSVGANHKIFHGMSRFKMA
jgi:deoxyribodipyrimidine photo-lyase